MRESSSERRTHPRFDTSLQLQGMPEEGDVVARMHATNLSLGGLYCTSTRDIAEMTRLGVRLMLPNGNGEASPVDLEAVVVRRRELSAGCADGADRYELALYFTNVAPEARERLSSYLERLQSPA